jgi:rod shape determining protein RodA
VNISMTVGMMPVTGLPLPFLSYGGSFLISCFMMLGILMNLRAHGEYL